MRLEDNKEEQERLKAEEEIRLADELRLKSEAGGFYVVGVDRRDLQVDFVIVLAAFGYWDLGVGRFWRWGNLGY